MKIKSTKLINKFHRTIMYITHIIKLSKTVLNPLMSFYLPYLT